MIKLDSVVIKSLPEDYILNTLKGTGSYRFNHFYLDEEDVEIAEARDTQDEVDAAMVFIEKNYAWISTSDGSPEDEIIQKIVKTAYEKEEDELGAWWDYLEENLKFPFKAEIKEYGGGSPPGTILKIGSLYNDDDEHYGIIIKGKENRFRGKTLYYPLCDLEAVDEKSPNYLHLRAYVVWFANR